MIQIENVDVWGFEHALRGMRNPLNSWAKSDSGYEYAPSEEEGIDEGLFFIVGEADLDLMKRLYKAGSEHRKYLRQIFVSMDVTAPLYWWKEMDQYKIGTVTDSCSTMHKIHEKPFELEDFSFDDFDYYGEWKDDVINVIESCEDLRQDYLKTKDKSYWYLLIRLLPSAYNQKRTVTMNYENVVSIIMQRSGHKLDEWNDFITELKKLPYITEIMGV